MTDEKRKPGRPARTKDDLPEGIGLFCDDAVGLDNGLSRSAIAHIRRKHGIPPADEPYRSRWFERHEEDDF